MPITVVKIYIIQNGIKREFYTIEGSFLMMNISDEIVSIYDGKRLRFAGHLSVFDAEFGDNLASKISRYKLK